MIGVRNATKKEIANFQKVEALLTEQEIDIIIDALDDDKTFTDLIHSKVNNEQINAIIKAHNITAKQLSDWYFTEDVD